jgi:DNA-binding response OmpR family regulator
MDRTFNVLLVEDDPALGEATVESLSALGHVVTLVRTAASAFDALRVEHSFEVILLDLRLGDESGDTIFDKLQLLQITYPPVIVLSAEPEAAIRLAARRIKTAHMLSKPASVGQIDRALRQATAMG